MNARQNDDTVSNSKQSMSQKQKRFVIYHCLHCHADLQANPQVHFSTSDRDS